MATVHGGESQLTSDEMGNQSHQASAENSDPFQQEEQNLENELAEIFEHQDTSQQVEPRTSESKSSQKASEPPSIAGKFLNSKSIGMARKLGYGLLIISVIDFIFILIPPQFLNPVWEYKVIGDIIKLVPLPVFAFLLIFVGERSHRKPIEKLPLKILSWVTLGISIFFFLLLPLIITDYVRIDRFNNSQISSEINLQKRKLNATQEQLSKLDDQQILDLIPERGQDGSLGAIPDTPEQAKENIVNNIERAKSQADARAATARSNVTLNLVKNSIKLFLQSLMSALLYIFLWTSTKWARTSKSKRKRRA